VTAETVPVTVRVEGVEHGVGAVAALATVDLEINGVGLWLRGVRITYRRGELSCDGPRFHDRRSGVDPGDHVAHELLREIATDLLETARELSS
jgi:hypothetical protein